MISWPAAKQMRWVKPSITTVSPSCTWRAMACCMVRTLEALSAISRQPSAQFGKALVEDRERRIHVVGVDDERRCQAQRCLPGAEQEQSLGEGEAFEPGDELGIRLARLPVLHELDPDHQSLAANLSDDLMALRELLHPSHEPRP